MQNGHFRSGDDDDDYDDDGDGDDDDFDNDNDDDDLEDDAIDDNDSDKILTKTTPKNTLFSKTTTTKQRQTFKKSFFPLGLSCFL